MKTLRYLLTLLIVSTGLVLHAQDTPKQAEMIRTANGRIVTPSGLAGPEKQLPKGMVLDVVKEEFADVTVSLRGQKLIVSKKDVTLRDKEDLPKSTVRGFTSGQLVILSAKYSLEGNQPRNVKGRLEKYVPEGGMLTKPFTFTITDDLSTAAANQKELVIETAGPSTTIIIPGGKGPNNPPKVINVPQTQVNVVKTAPNVLRVEYSYNGVKRVKVGYEGQKMTLP